MDTQYITTTELRTETAKLVDILNRGEQITLVHRSKIIGNIKPVEKVAEKIFDLEGFRKALSQIKFAKKLSYKQRDRLYRRHLMEKYGKGLS